MAHIPEHPSDEQLRAMLERLMVWEIDDLMGFRFKLPAGKGPFYDWYRTKAENIASVVRWTRRAPPESIRPLMGGTARAENEGGNYPARLEET
jgi:hypothetical protein